MSKFNESKGIDWVRVAILGGAIVMAVVALAFAPTFA